MLESGHAHNVSDAGCSGVNGDEDDEEDDGRRHKGKKGLGRAKQVMLYPLRKAKKQILRRKIKRAASSNCSSCSSSSGSVGGGARRAVSLEKRGVGDDGSVNQGCGFCFRELISDSKSGSSQITDPNHRKFTDEMLRVLIEKNDFYSTECNPHLDAKVDTRQRKH